MRRSVVNLSAALAACSALAIGGVSIASGGSSSPAKPAAAVATTQEPANGPAEAASEAAGSTESGAAGETESAADTAAQAAASQKAGIDPNVANVQFDDQTGTCSLDSGSDSGN